MLLLNGLTPWHWAPSGFLLGLITLLLLGLANRSLGVSTGFESVCALASRRPYFHRLELKDRWRLVFLLGLVLGGALSAWTSGGFAEAWGLGMLDDVLTLSASGKLAWMFVGGLLIGFGTRLAGGCTSGHGIFGLSNREPGSLVTTLAFMAAGIAMTHLLHATVLR